jgi:hypothetical protein
MNFNGFSCNNILFNVDFTKGGGGDSTTKNEISRFLEGQRSMHSNK